MGACMKSGESAQSPTRQLVVTTNIPNSQGYDASLINKSYFYFLFRKEIYARLKDRLTVQTQFIDMREAKEYNAFHSYLAVNIGTIENIDSSIKILYDFRIIVLLDDTRKDSGYQLPPNYISFLAKLKEFKVIPTKILILAMPIKDLMREYQMFIEAKNQGLQRSAMNKLNLPILVFDNEELRPKDTEQRLRIYIHNLKMYERNILLEPSFYKTKLAIKMESTGFCSDSVQSANDLAKISALKKQIKDANIQGCGLLILHSLSDQQDIIIKNVMKIIAELFEVNYSNALQYFSEKFPTVSNQVTDEEKKQVVYSMIRLQKPEPKGPLTKSQEFEELLSKYYKESGKNTLTQKACNLCNMLLDNICKNPDPESFRTIKATNAQLGEVLFKYKYGKKLLESIGFYPQEGNIYRNDLEVKYLRTHRTDLELAYRRFEDSLKK